MENQEKFSEKLKAYFGESLYLESEDGHQLSFSQKDMKESFFHLFNQFQCILLLDICLLESDSKQNLLYQLYSLKYSQRVRVKVLLAGHENIESMSHIWAISLVYENEIQRNSSLVFCNFAFPSSFYYKKGKNEIFETLKKEKVFRSVQISEKNSSQNCFWESFGPTWPNERGCFFLHTLFEDNTVKDIFVELGHEEKHWESKLETLDPFKALAFVKEINPSNFFNLELLYCLSIEKIWKISIPNKAKFLRMIFMELSRIRGHFQALLAMLREAESIRLFELIETHLNFVDNIFVSFMKQRSHPSFSLNQLGGVSLDFNVGHRKQLVTLLNAIFDGVSLLEKKLDRSFFWKEQTSLIYMSAKEAILNGCTGPLLRALGINYDLRKVNPFYYYSEVDFEVPLGIHDQIYDCYLVRVAEIFQSLNIIKQLLQNMPSGDVLVQDGPLGEFYKVFDANINEVEDYRNLLKAFKLPSHEIYTSLESSNGELGLFISCNGESHPQKLKWRSPNTPNLLTLTKMASGKKIEDLMIFLASLNISTLEIER